MRAIRCEGGHRAREMIPPNVIIRVLVDACEREDVIRQQQLRPGTRCKA